MIIRADQSLSNIVLKADCNTAFVDDISSGSSSVWDGDRLIKIPESKPEDNSYLKDLVPEWLETILLESSTAIISIEDWNSLDYRIQECITVIKY